MLGINREWMRWRALVSFLTAVVLVLSLISCGDRASTSKISGSAGTTSTGAKVAIAEISPPKVIQQLSSSLEVYKPQVSIITPRPNEIFPDSRVEVRFQVQDLPIFKDPKLGLGSHLQVILDNQPYQEVYDLSQPLILKDLSPGTHTLRVFASRPWYESFKNEGAYAQTTFHIFTKTPNNNPNPAQPLLTYSRPMGTYGAEPIMLDFYLTNAPLHLVAQEKPDDEIADWRIRATVNGQSFVLDRWEPIYLKGFTPGKNWIQLEFIDEKGNPVNNVYNNTVGLITYEPKGKDTLSKLVRGEVSADQARSIVDLNYTPKLTPAPVEKPTLSAPVPPPLKTPTVKEKPVTPEVAPAKPPESAPVETKQSKKPQPGGFVEPFQQPPSTQETTPIPAPVQPKVIIPPSEKILAPETSPTPSPKVETTSIPEPAPVETKESEKPRSGGFFNRFWRRPPTKDATPAPSVPEVIPAPSPKPVPPQLTVPPSEATSKPLPSAISTPKDQPPARSEPAPKVLEKEQGKSDKLFFPTPIPTRSPILPPTLPEVIPPPTPAPFSSVAPSQVPPPAIPEIIVPPTPESVVPEKKKVLLSPSSAKPDAGVTPQQQDIQPEPKTSEAPTVTK